MTGSRFFGGVLGLTCLLSLAGRAAPPAQRNILVDTQLKAIFTRLDLNADGFLDAGELAKAFRGKNAKPAPPMYDDKGNVNPEYVKTRSKYPDMIYLSAMDTDGDGMVSWDEFRVYGETYAAALQKKQAQQQSLQNAYLRAMQNRTRSAYRQTNYNRYRSGRNYHNYGGYRPSYQSPYVYQQRAAQAYQAAANQMLNYQMNLVRQREQMMQAMYSRARQMYAYRAPVSHGRRR